MATPVIHHSVTTGAAANPDVLVDGVAWDAAHTVTGLENVPNVDTTNADNITGGGLGSGSLARASLVAASGGTVTATGTSRTALSSDLSKIVNRSNSGANMQDTLPGSVLPSGIYSFRNTDASGILAIVVASGPTLDGSATAYIVVGPNQTAIIQSDGSNYRTLSAPTRAKLSAGTTATIYVQATGSDNNPGVLSSSPKATRQAIYDEMYQRYDLNAARMVIQHTGNFTDSGVTLRGRPPGVGNSAATTPYAHAIHFIGDQVTPTNCTITSTGACFNAINEATFHIDGFKLISSAGDCISSNYDSVLGVAAVNYGAAFGNHKKASFDGKIHFDNSYTVSGGAQSHMLMLNGGKIENQGGAITCTMVGTPAFSSATISIQSEGLLAATGLTFSGAATGLRFAIGPFGGNGNVGTFGTDPNTLIPGNASGTYAGGDGSMNGFSNPSVTSLNVTGLSANSFVKTDSSKNLATFATANSGVLVTDGSGAPSISTTLPTGLALQTPASGVGTNLTALNATQLTSGAVPAARMPALTGDGTTSAGAVALTVTKINGVDQTTAWTTYTPTITSQTGTITTSSATGRYKQIGKTIFLQADITITTAGTGAGGLRATLPFTAAAFNYVGIGKEITGGKSGGAQIGVSGTFLDTRDSTGTTFIASGAEVVATIVYEIP